MWAFDASKQAMGSGWAHVLNLMLAMMLSGADNSTPDECALYFINFVIDTTIGVCGNIWLLGLMKRLADRHGWDSLQTTGFYGDPLSFAAWGKQLAAWLAIVLLVKVVLGSAEYLLRSPLAALGDAIFSPVSSSPNTELLIVMVLCPGLMNLVQYWVQDNFLKSAEREADGGDREGRQFRRGLLGAADGAMAGSGSGSSSDFDHEGSGSGSGSGPNSNPTSAHPSRSHSHSPEHSAEQTQPKGSTANGLGRIQNDRLVFQSDRVPIQPSALREPFFSA